jgi:hypothetical protein
MSAELWRTAFQRFVEAVNQPRDAALLGAAVIDDVHIERHEPGERGAAVIAETFAGAAEVARWLQRTPAATAFALAGDPWPDRDPRWGIRYEVRAGEFRNGGVWLARLAGDGRIAALSHHPFALPDDR